MMETLESIDRAIVLFVNGWNTPFLDELFWWISQRITWVPLYIFLLVIAWRNLEKRTFAWMVALTILSVVLADLLSVHAFKNVFQRYRPSHHADLTDLLHFYIKPNGELYKGGMYGFVSSHAANFFALAMSLTLFLKSKLKWIGSVMFSIAGVVAFSRLYQGVHYLSDLLVGAILGCVIACVLHSFVYSKLKSVE
jgi:undecaprenyl-diphosphatase